MNRRRNNNEENEEERGIPSKLLQQIQTKEDKGDYNDEDRFTKFNSKKRKEKPLSRKDRRQQERQLKKQKKNTKPINNEAKRKAITNNNSKSIKTSQKPVKSQTKEDSRADFKALKTNRAQTSTKTIDDPVEQLRLLKEKKKGSQPNEFRVVKADELLEDSDGDDNFDDFDNLDDFDDYDDEVEENPLEVLKKLKEVKKGSKNKSEVRVIKLDELLDDELSEDVSEDELSEDEEEDENEDIDDNDSNVKDNFDGFDEEENEDSEDGFIVDDDNIDADDFDSFDEEEILEEEEDPLAKLKALKEQKRNVKKDNKPSKEVKNSRVISQHELELMKRDENDMEFYAKKLGLKNGKKSKIAKTDDDDIIGGLLDGLDFDFEEEMEPLEEEADDFDEGEEENYSGDDFDDDEEDAPKKENPYVAPIQNKTSDEVSDSSNHAAGSYIPPALRRKMALEGGNVSEEILNLRKAIKGPLNKLSESNISSIVNEINTLYLSNSRNSVNNELTTIVMDSIIQQGRLLDTFVYLHATLVVAIYRLQGVEFGAHFIQSMIEKFESYHKETGKGKEASNMISLLSSVYQFQLVSSKLLYDVIKVLINELNENNAELLLRLIRNSGNQMRSDDPSALKDIVILLNDAKSSIPQSQMSTRTQFLVETITSLKNNKLKINNESSHQLAIRLKKFLATINNNKFNDPIQVSLNDIHSIASKGKWWLVGAAWKGSDGDDKNAEPDLNRDAINDILDNSEPNWMDLARSQRMNTDIRRAIFISIMSANDYIDALTKLDKLALKRSQDREIPRVLIHCTSVEPAYNPYYGILASKLCEDHRYRKTFQFMLWDLIKEFEGSTSDEDEDFVGFDHGDDDDETKLKRILNLGRFFGFLLAEGSLPLHLLRTVNFLTAASDTILFMEVVFVSFLDNIGKKSQINSVGAGLGKRSKNMYEQKFDDRLLIERVIKAQEQMTLLRGIQFFLQDKVRKSDIISGKKQTRRVEWGINAMVDIIEEFVRSNDDKN